MPPSATAPVAGPGLASAAGSIADAFLFVQTKRAGKVKGEAVTAGHAEEIEVTGWQWGVNQHSALGGQVATARRSYQALVVHKRVDTATTALLSALATNDEVKEAKLTLRRAGGRQEDFFMITLREGRIAALQHAGDADGSTRETVTIAFTKVQVEYRVQQVSGALGGSSLFVDELPQSA